MKTPGQANGEALPDSKTPDEMVADAMRGIEPELADLVLMARIVTDIMERLLARPDSRADGVLVFRLSPTERDAALFGIGDVEARAVKLKTSYMAAWDAGTRSRSRSAQL